MPRFFFNKLLSDATETDLVGEELSTSAEARRHAWDLATDLIQTRLATGEPPTGWVEVEDEDHRPVLLLPLRSVAS